MPVWDRAGGATVAKTSRLDPLMRLPEVMAICRRMKSTIYADMALGRFPRPVRIGIRAVAWRRSDIKAWLKSRPIA